MRYLCVLGPGESVSRGEAPVRHPLDSGNLNPQKWHLSASSCTLSAHSGHFLVLNTLNGLSLRSRSLRMPSAARALYRQLSEQIAHRIRAGLLARGERLPATRELAGLLGLNRTTVSAAYEILESEGLISGQVGRGSFVTGAAETAGGVDWNGLLERSDTSITGPNGGWKCRCEIGRAHV